MNAADTSVLVTPDGVRLHFRSWQPAPHPRASVLLVHGVGEHSGRYQWLAEWLVGQGLAVYAWDHRGHGLSSGRRGHVGSWSEYRADLQLCLDHARRSSPAEAPLFVLGHSMGALVALDAVIHSAPVLAGLALSGVPMEPAGVAKWHLVLLARVLARLWPAFPIRLPLAPEQLTSRRDDLDLLAADPLLLRKVTARWGLEAMRALATARLSAFRITLPLLVLHGGQDPVNRVEGARWLLHHAGSEDKQLRVYAQSRHEPHQDLERETFARDVADWALTRARMATSDLPLPRAAASSASS